MVKVFAQKARFLFQKKQTSIFSAALVIMVTVALSRVLGLIRVRMLAERFTADELGVYFAAFRLPNLLFELLVMGALSTAFIPVISQLIARGKNKEVFYVTSSVINIATVIFTIITLLLLVFLKETSMAIAPGFNKEELNTMILFARIMLVGQVVPLLIGNFLTGLLQSFRLFLIPALAPVLYNVGIIIGIIFLSPSQGLYGAVYGVVIGAILFLAVQIPLVYSLGYRHLFVIDHKDKDVRTIGKLMLPRTFGIAASQIDATVDLMLASLLGTRNVTIFNFAQQLQFLPVGLIGIPIATAALPSLSTSRELNNIEEFKDLFVKAFHQILFFVLPISTILIVLRIPIVRLVFGAERFDWPATVLTGMTVAYFSISLFAQSIVHLLTRAFYALNDSKTPVVGSIIAIITNIILSFLLILRYNLPVWGLGLSASVASIINAIILFLILHKKIGKFDLFNLIVPVIKMGTATVITGISLYIPMKLLDKLIFDTTRTINLIMLSTIATSIGLLVYIFVSWVLELEEVALFSLLAKKFVRVKQLFIETPREVVNEGDIQHSS